jgi:Holliday junction resolvase-like predicted endonuclease
MDWHRHRRRIGRLGEDLTVMFLRRRGCEILDRNVGVGRGEIDVIAARRGMQFVVEVKTGIGSEAQPQDAFDDAKATQVRSLCRALDPPLDRVDLVTVRIAEDGIWLWWTPFVA